MKDFHKSDKSLGRWGPWMAQGNHGSWFQSIGKRQEDIYYHRGRLDGYETTINAQTLGKRELPRTDGRILATHAELHETLCWLSVNGSTADYDKIKSRLSKKLPFN